jgi:LysR family transcriptional regulator, transcriptional activator of the cysJI operon
MINPDFIQTFVALAQTRHFTKTAKLLHMTQPGVTQHIKKLEEHFGVSLIERGRPEVVLTDAGRMLEQYGARLADEHRKLRESLQTDNPYVGRVRMSSPGSWGLLLLDVMIACAKKHPGLRVDLTTSPSAEIARRVANDEIDIGYATVPTQDPRLNCEKFKNETLCVVVPGKANPKTFADFQKLGVIWHPDLPYLLDRVFMANFKEYRGLEDFPIRCGVNQMNRILDPIEAGLGFSILPNVSVEYYVKGRKVKNVYPGICVNEQLYRITHKRRKLPLRVTYVEAEFVKELKKYSY